jgi:hypothetical protein
MRVLTKILIGVGALVVLLAALAFGGWYFFLKSDPKPPAAITKTTIVGGGTLDGTYRAASGDPQSFVGYRVQESSWRRSVSRALPPAARARSRAASRSTE